MTVRRIGVSTGGGDCPGLNAVIRALVKAGANISQQSAGPPIEFIGIEDGLMGLLTEPLGIMPLDFATVRGLLPKGGTILGTTNRGNPFRFPQTDPVTGETREVDVSDRMIAAAERLGLDGLVMIGGDGTLAIGKQLMERGLPVIGVPKTIDNDLSATDQTFGFDTAVGIAMDALDRLHTTAASHDRVMLLEVMGRHAGWIALHAGIAGGADFIVIPEIPYDVNAILDSLALRQSGGSQFAIGVVAEGAKPKGGDVSVAGPAIAGENPRLSGASFRLEDALQAANCPLQTRVTVLGHTQRGGTPSAFDRILATRYGAAAARLVHEGGWGRMVCLRTPRIDSVPLDEALAEHRVDPDGELVRQAERIGINLGR
jgi:6-phosphofructokinase 1